MKRLVLITTVATVFAPVAHAETDEEILERVRASATKVFMDQAHWTLPESFRNSGLAPSDKERLTKQWASASATCLADALAEYSRTTDVPLADMVSDDGSFTLSGGSRTDFELSLSTCVERAWEAVGASLK